MKTKDKPQAKQYVIYSRKSKFTGKGESIENQIELCRQYIAMHFGEDAAENVLVYEDEGFSGGNLERPQFKKMMKDSQKIAFAAIVVYRLDRISRNIGDFAKIIEEIRKLSADKETLAKLLAQTKKVISGSKDGYDAELALLREKHTETEDRIKRLVESLSVASDTSAKYVMEQIDALHQESETQQLRLAELEALTEQSRMLHQEFAFHQEMIESFASAVDSATLEEKRRLLRTIVKKVVWDGKNAYVYLFAEDGEADLPPIDQPMYPLGEDSESNYAERGGVQPVDADEGGRAEYTDDRAPHGGLRYGGQRHDNRGGYRLLREPAGGRCANGERKRDLLPGPAAARAVHGNL